MLMIQSYKRPKIAKKTDIKRASIAPIHVIGSFKYLFSTRQIIFFFVLYLCYCIERFFFLTLSVYVCCIWQDTTIVIHMWEKQWSNEYENNRRRRVTLLNYTEWKPYSIGNNCWVKARIVFWSSNRLVRQTTISLYVRTYKAHVFGLVCVCALRTNTEIE